MNEGMPKNVRLASEKAYEERKKRGVKDGSSLIPKGRGRGATKENNPDLEEGYNSRYIQFVHAITPEDVLDYQDVDEMERRFNHYLEMCDKYDMKVGNQAAYYAIGVNAFTVRDWENAKTPNPKRSQFIKKVKSICSMYREGLMQDGKVNPVVGIFWQKNYDGMRDQQEIVVAPSNPLGEQRDPEQLKQKYLESTYGADMLPDHGEPITIDVPAKEVIAEPESKPIKRSRSMKST